MKTVTISRTCFWAKVFVLLLGISFCSASAAQNRSITIGTYPFPEDIAVTHVWKQLLEKKGYNVTIKEASRPIIVFGVAHGDLDFALELWLPYTDKDKYEAVKDKVTLIGPWYDKAWQGLAVPDYMHIKTIGDLRKIAGDFDKKIIYTADAGAVVTEHAKGAIKKYDLPFKALVSTEAAAITQLSRAYPDKKPIVLTLWRPHWAWAEYNLHMLVDPKGAFTKPNHIYAYTTKGFEDSFPKVARWLSQFHLNAKQLPALMNKVRQSNSPQKVASQWISSHKPVWQKWLANP